MWVFTHFVTLNPSPAFYGIIRSSVTNPPSWGSMCYLQALVHPGMSLYVEEWRYYPTSAGQAEPCWEKPQRCKTPMANSLLLQAEVWCRWPWLGGTKVLAVCLFPSAWRHLPTHCQPQPGSPHPAVFPSFSPFHTQARLQAIFAGFFPARGLNLLSPSWEHSVAAALAGWPGCHRSWCPFHCQIRGHCRDAREALQIRRCASSSRFQIQQHGFHIQPTGSEFISPMQTALHCLSVN